jgi:hypothetical protein
MNVRKVTDTSYEFVSLEYEKFQEEKNTAGLIHFIPKNQKEMKASMLLADATEIPLLLEENGMYLKPGAIIQFERYCFARLDHIKEDGTLMFWYTHD